MSSHPFFLGLLAIATLGFAALLAGFWKAIFWAAVFGILFQPVHVRLTSRLQGRASLSAGLTVLLIFFTVLVPALLVASAMTREAASLYRQVQSGEIDPGVVVRWIQEFLPQAGQWAANLGVDLERLPERISEAALSASQFVASLALTAGQNIGSFLLMFFLMLYLLFFTLRDGPRIVQKVHRAVPLPDAYEKRLFDKFAEVSRATIKGSLVIAVVQGSLGGLIFAILGIQGAVFWGVVMAVLSFIPAVGAGLIWVPAALFLALSGDWGKGLILAVYGVVVIGLSDNLLRPILVGRDTRMPDYLVLFSTLGGLALMGVTGVVLGPVIAALFMACWDMYAEEHEAENQRTLGEEPLPRKDPSSPEDPPAQDQPLPARSD